MPPGSSWPERNTVLGTRRSQPALPTDSCPDQQAAQMPEDAPGLARRCTISHYSLGPCTRTSSQGAASSCTFALSSCIQAAVEHIPPSPPLGGLLSLDSQCAFSFGLLLPNATSPFSPLKLPERNHFQTPLVWAGSSFLCYPMASRVSSVIA